MARGVSARRFSMDHFRRVQSGELDANQIGDDHITCLVLHPVSYPNHGPIVEHSLAQEALGLARSLDWALVDGPSIEMKDSEESDHETLLDELGEEGRGRVKPKMFSATESQNAIEKENIRDGDYVYSPAGISGVYFRGGLVCDFEDQHDPW